ncbi:hypothetical protein [Klebsiella oxytoca]|uniref:hypothetical protein n=1 Tax=Klebsiella oxytoca TaxID=571 RepID=UPI00259966DA|nr:hypothetical protein [Klebsiella oxytoca]MDM4095921.1 hypothetical protein [Klebsiella oxytoca]
MSDYSHQIIELLTLCQQLQSEKDGIQRPAPDKAPVGVSDTFDNFSRQIHQACLYASMIDSLLALQSRLVDTGRQLELQGQIHVEAGDNYAVAAVAWLELFTGTVNAQ